MKSMKSLLILFLIGCITGCSLLKGESAKVDDICSDASVACATALSICSSTTERAALAKSSSDAISKSVLQCNKVSSVCEDITSFCARD